MKALRHAIDLGYGDYDWMENDPDLSTLRKYPEFGDIIETLKKN